MDDAKWAGVEVQLTGLDSNKNTLIEAVSTALREAGGIPEEEILQFESEAREPGSMTDLVDTIDRWVTAT